MIGYMTGDIISPRNSTEDPVTFLPSSGCVGYEVRICGVLANGRGNIWVHVHAPQDAPNELYGFVQKTDRDLFRRLLEIKGVGPKVAMRIVSAKGINANGVPVPSTLASVRGVGQKIIAAIMEHFNA